MRPPRRSDPTIEFHEQDNLALESLGSHFTTSVTDGVGTGPSSAAARDAAAGSLYPPADFIYDNSCYNNMRQVMLFPGALHRYAVRCSSQACVPTLEFPRIQLSFLVADLSLLFCCIQILQSGGAHAQPKHWPAPHRIWRVVV